ncbi:MAG TPA: hypothetical protein VFX76_18530 [Roseiflexaceae bacterium]|nr:hypothetical protein [Roseiflexaceae bacterium]
MSALDAQPRIERRPLDISALLSEVAEQSRPLLQQHMLDVEVASDLWVEKD